ncbi:hypothetical protein PV05_06672 [Exophiala xenobiotica]|uniref:Uncharacterized protein n=1 Tax=Exophiala xenobiotica TaxID=348802 RepID=A0A0D2BP06_9EURO|nr:uncharacterized protein PV05_06672 [Exophiala xenobiotica]KIW54306.1 hypothetical protein PV05_06672 [Exophiala xenobiotica]
MCQPEPSQGIGLQSSREHLKEIADHFWGRNSAANDGIHEKIGVPKNDLVDGQPTEAELDDDDDENENENESDNEDTLMALQTMIPAPTQHTDRVDLENPFNAKSPPKRTRDACDIAEERHTEPSKRQRLAESAKRSDGTDVNGKVTANGNIAAELGGNKVVSAEFARGSEIRARRNANGDWPYLRKLSTFTKLSLSERSQTLRTWTSDTEDYIGNIQAGTVPVAKVLDFFDLVDVHLDAESQRMLEITLTIAQSLEHHVKTGETFEKLQLEKEELLTRFLPSMMK